jgi:glycosyltransferase involved in cell wall biosynthesis
MKTSLDACVIRDNRVFAYGWAFDRQSAVAALRLELALADGTAASLPVTSQKERADVASAFAGEPQARFSGWLVYGAWEGPDAVGLSLAGRLEDGRAFTCSLPVGSLPRARPGLRERAGQLARKWLRRRRAATPGGVAELASRAWLHEISAALRVAGQERCSLVIDHAMGGGASEFSRTWVAERLRARPLVLVLSFDLATLRYTVEMKARDGQSRTFSMLQEPASPLADTGLVDDILYNDAVSFPRPELVPAWLLAFRSVPGSALTMAIHDYLAICPSQFLLNDGGRFCGVPDLAECARCLPRNDNEFARLFPSASMPAWRNGWGQAVQAADAIVCFSASSHALLRRAYPSLTPERIRVEPHEATDFPEPAAIDLGRPLHIGVVGAIGWHKGAGVLQDLAAEIARRGLPVKITVIGSLHGRADAAVIRTTGPFARPDLPRLISESGANVFLLPSICPETFSYVTQELMSLRVPLACFDFGAPADRVAAYGLGRVVPRASSADLLDQLLRFHQDVATRHSELA